MIERITTAQAPAAIGPYSQAVATGEMVFVSGQLGIEPQSGKLADDTVEGQTKRAIENVKAILSAAGSDLSKVVSMTVYLADMADFAKMNEIYAQYFNQPYPARTTVAVRQLPKNAKVEIAAIAVR